MGHNILCFKNSGGGDAYVYTVDLPQILLVDCRQVGKNCCRM